MALSMRPRPTCATLLTMSGMDNRSVCLNSRTNMTQLKMTEARKDGDNYGPQTTDHRQQLVVIFFEKMMKKQPVATNIRTFYLSVILPLPTSPKERRQRVWRLTLVVCLRTPDFSDFPTIMVVLQKCRFAGSSIHYSN